MPIHGVIVKMPSMPSPIPQQTHTATDNPTAGDDRSTLPVENMAGKVISSATQTDYSRSLQHSSKVSFQIFWQL